MGKSSRNGPLSMAMLNNQMVNEVVWVKGKWFEVSMGCWRGKVFFWCSHSATLPSLGVQIGNHRSTTGVNFPASHV